MFWLCVIIVISSISWSCSNSTKANDNEFTEDREVKLSYHKKNQIEEDTVITNALDALTEIQVSGNGGMMLYLTFPFIAHKECTGGVGFYEISQAEFQDVLMDVMKQNNRHLSDSEKRKLAAAASCPMKKYKLKYCAGSGQKVDVNASKFPPRKGTWVFTAIFGASDLLINWG